MENNYIINSTSDVVIQKKIDEIISMLNGEYDKIKLDGEEDSIITLLQELKTAPFLTNYRVVILKNPKFLYTQSIDKRLISEFISYVRKPLDTTIFILVLQSTEIIKLNKEEAFIELKKCSKEFNLVEDVKDIDSLIDNDFLGYKILDNAKRELKLRTQSDSIRVVKEIEKLKTYKYPDKEITYKDVDLLVSRDLEDKVYLLTASIIKKSKVEALNLYSDFKKNGISDSVILSSIINKFQELYQVKLMSSEGYTKDMVAEEFKVKSGRAYYMMQDAKEVRLDTIKDKYSEALILDYDIKRGVADKDSALWFYLLKL